MKINLLRFAMRSLLLFCFVSTLTLVSCQEDPKIRILEQEKEAKNKKLFSTASIRDGVFNAQTVTQTAGSLTSNWAEWRMFLTELGQKPKSSIGAFKQKAKTLSKRALELNNNIPMAYNTPEVKSRIAAITTKINAVNLYINLQQIPDQKIVELIPSINTEVNALQFQLEEITRKSQIKMEEGESDMLQMLDTTRAIPSSPKVKSLP